MGFYYGSGGGHEGWFVLIPIILLVAMRMLAVRNRRSCMGGGRPPMPRGSYFTGGSGAAGSGPVVGDTVVEEPQRTGMAAGWLPDPTGSHEERYWSGREWTEHVRTGGVPDSDPYPGAPTGDQSGATEKPEPPKAG